MIDQSLPLVVIACKVLQDLIEDHLPAARAAQITFMEYGLHRVPANLNSVVQDAIDAVAQPSLIVLGYGLCGNGLKDIQAGRHTLLVPRADDCIAMLLGSRQAYFQQFEAEPGTYYLSKGWLESGSHPLNEYREYAEKYGHEDAQWIMDQQYQHYRRLALVVHNRADLEKHRPVALEVAAYCQRWGMQYEEIIGTDRFVRRLVQAIDSPTEPGDDFLVIPPYGTIRQEMFI